jgi:hypothetical protein
MAMINAKGKVAKLEGGDLATVGLMAANLYAHGMAEDPPDAADKAIQIYNAVIETATRYNAKNHG